MTLYCGIDLHANNNVLSVIDERDAVVYEKRHPNDLRATPFLVRAVKHRSQAFRRLNRMCPDNRTWLLSQPR